MNGPVFSRISDGAIGLSLSAELKAAVAINGHEEQLFRWVGCRKTPALLCLRADPNPIAQFAQRLFLSVARHDPSLAAVYESHAQSVFLVSELNSETKNTN